MPHKRCLVKFGRGQIRLNGQGIIFSREQTLIAARLAALEQEYARSPALLKMLGRAFGFGAAGKLERARFKVSYKREQLDEFEALHLDWRSER